MDAKIVQSASRSRWDGLLDADVETHEYQPSMYHCKVLMVDDVWVSVGSTNFDDRSFRLNDEREVKQPSISFYVLLAAVPPPPRSTPRAGGAVVLDPISGWPRGA